ncbi:hypothetical protein KPL47_23860 [Clostridium estertheticum]|uniref:hypothetical protein n=1 Tax=Clostridium estertheticum TaxID=238834 RepID=UPI001C0A9D0F|nr:hypothetical protein [Clostridium estertheticum]MBU3179328.1 hypothetical protein [Clostridium estertheticum]
MEFIGIMAFIIAISNMGLSDKVKKLKADVKKINTSIKGEIEMSKILKALEGKRCTLSVIAKGPVDWKLRASFATSKKFYLFIIVCLWAPV